MTTHLLYFEDEKIWQDWFRETVFEKLNDLLWDRYGFKFQKLVIDDGNNFEMALNDAHITVVLLDYELPKSRSCEIFKQINGTIPVIIFTQYSEISLDFLRYGYPVAGFDKRNLADCYCDSENIFRIKSGIKNKKIEEFSELIANLLPVGKFDLIINTSSHEIGVRFLKGKITRTTKVTNAEFRSFMFLLMCHLEARRNHNPMFAFVMFLMHQVMQNHVTDPGGYIHGILGRYSSSPKNFYNKNLKHAIYRFIKRGSLVNRIICSSRDDGLGIYRFNGDIEIDGQRQTQWDVAFNRHLP